MTRKPRYTYRNRLTREVIKRIVAYQRAIILLTDAAEILGVQEKTTVYRYIKSGHWPPITQYTHIGTKRQMCACWDIRDVILWFWQRNAA